MAVGGKMKGKSASGKYIQALINSKHEKRHFGLLKNLKGIWFNDPL